MEKVLEIAVMFSIPRVSKDQVMLRIFPMTLKGGAKRWINNEPAGSITTWEDLRTKFLKMYCPPSKTSKMMTKLEASSKNQTSHFIRHGLDTRICCISVLNMI